MRTHRPGESRERAAPRRRLVWSLALIVVALVGSAALSLTLLDAVQQQDSLRHEADLAQLERLSGIADAYTLTVARTVADAERGRLTPEQAAEDIALAQADAGARWRDFREDLEPSREGPLVEEIDARLAATDAWLDDLRALAQQGGPAAFVDGADTLADELAPLGTALAELRGAYRAEAGAQAREASAAFDRLETAAVGLVAALGVVVLVLVARLERARRISARRAQRLKALLDDSPDLVARFDAGLRHRYVNEAVVAVTGRSRAELLGHTIAEQELPPALTTRWEEALADVLATGEPRTLEVELPTVGGPRALQTRLVAERDTRGAPVGVLAVTRDVTALRSAREALQSGLDQQRRLADLAAIGVAIDALDPLLEDAVALLTDTLEIAGAAVVTTADGNALHVRARRGWAAEAVPGEVLDAGRAALHGTGEGADREPAATEPASAMAGTPIRTPHGAYGALVVGLMPPRALNGEDRLLLEAVADVLGATAGRLEAQASLRERSLRDPLTGLANRTLLLDRTQLALDRLSRVEGRVAVAFLDVDDFKLINDGLGHDVGDALLVEVAARLASIVRPGDTIARFGGDEFVVLCEGLDAHDDATRLASRLLESMRGTFSLDGHLVRVTVSIGLAVVTDGVAAGELLRWADTAMYRAKARGRARIEVFDDTLRDDVERRLGLRTGLERALERGELRLAYQPQIAIADGQVLGAEALLRWQHPDHGELEPAAFLAVAEDSGLISAIGRWVRREAIAQAVRWQPLGAPQLSLNLSSRDLEDESLVDELAGLLAEHGLAPPQLCLEVTENAVLRDLASAQRALEALAELGVVIALDDFGTGYSSLRHLHELPVALVKIDSTFVQRLDATGRHDPLVAGAFALLSRMGLRTVAEGVETRAQLDALADLGCTIVQGFLFSPPVSPEAMGAILADPRGLAPTSPPSSGAEGSSRGAEEPPPGADPQPSPD